MDDRFYRNLVEHSPFGYAYHRILTNDAGVAVDYLFLDMNSEFELITGLKREDILNRPVSEVLPGIHDDEFNWIELYGEVALGGKPCEFEQYSEKLRRHFKVKVHAPEKGYFVTIITDITPEMQLTYLSRKFLEKSERQIDYSSISDELLSLSGAHYVAFNIFDEFGKDFTTVALSGRASPIEKVTKRLGFDVVGKRWKYDPIRQNRIEGRTITRFEHLLDLTGKVLSKQIVSLIEKSFDLGPVYVVKVMKNDIMLGDFTLMMPRDTEIKNKGMVEVFAGQVGLFLDREEVQRKLQQSYERMELAMDAGEHGFWDWDFDNDEIYFSPGYYKMLGYKPGDFPMTKDAWVGLMHPEDRETVVPRIEEHISKAEPYSMEFRLKCKNGEWKWVVGSGKSFGKDEKGAVHRAVGVHVDIDERKKAEGALRQEKKDQQILLDNMQTQVWYLEDEHTYGAVNRAHAEFNGMPVEKLAFKDMYDIFPEDVVEVCRKGNIEVFTTGKTVRSEEWVPHASGEQRLISITKTPKLNEEGGVEYVVCSASDITEKDKIQRDLRENEERFSLALEGTGAGLWDWDMITDTVHYSPLWKSMLGYGDNEVVNSFEGWKCLWHPEDTPKIEEAIEDYLEGRSEAYQIEHRLRHKNGEWRWILTRGSMMSDDEGKPYRWVGTNIDITANKELQEEYRTTRDFLDSVLENIHDGISVLETDFTVRHVNRRMVEWYGDSEELLGKKCYEVFQHRNTICENCPVLRSIKSRKPESTVVHGWPAEGIEWVELLVFPMIDDTTGEITGIIELVRDITVRKRAEERLVSSEKNFRTFFETIDDMIFIGNKQGKIFFTNSAVTKKLGYNSDELTGMHVLDVHSPDDREEAEQIFTEMFAGDRDFCPLPLQAKGGKLIPVETRVWFGEWDGKDCIFGISKDLSKEQAALQKFNKLFDRNPALMAVSILPERRFTEVNEAFLKKMGYARDEIIGKTSEELEIFIEHDKQQLIAEKLNQQGRIENCELKVRAKDGTILDGLFSGEIIDSQGLPSFLTVMTDITEQKQAEEQVEFQRSQIQSLFEYSSAAMVMMDLENRVMDANRAFEQVFGYTLQEAEGEMLENLICPERFLEFESKELDRESLVGIKGTDIIRRRKDYREIHVRVSAGPIKMGGKINGRFAIFNDITEQKEAQDALAQANRHLEEQTVLAKEMAAQAEMASKAKSEFLANMSHEIRTPMNAVVGFTDLLLTTNLDSVQTQYLENVNSSAEALLMLINDILDFSKIEAGRLELEYTTVNLREQLERAMDIITYRAHAKGLELILNIDPHVPHMVVTDPVRLHQVVTNLLSNAAKFTEEGEVELKAERIDTENPSSITLTVRDTGIGMTADQRKKIFNSFTQADHSTTRKYGGTGLGLSISKSLVEKFGGTLIVDSEPGRGSSFSFTLPFKVVEEKEQEKPAKIDIKKVLIVDDNSNNRTILEGMCTNWGIHTETASNGMGALEKLSGKNDFDVVVLDYHMPFMDGLDVAEKIRNEIGLSSKESPIIFLYSSAEDPHVIERCRELKIEYRLVKPIKMKQLYELFYKVHRGEKQHCSQVSASLQEKTVGGKLNKEGGNTEQDRAKAQISILIAEDNSSNMLLARGLISKKFPQAECIAAVTGEEAVELYNTRYPDIILMDVQMPELDGYGATKKIRALEEDKGIEKTDRTPIIALTAGALEGDREKALEAGMNDYLSKPVTISSLSLTIEKWLKQTSPSKEKEVEVKESGEGVLQRSMENLIANGHDENTVEEMFDMLIERLPQLSGEITESLSKEDIVSSRRDFHSLKGIFNTLCMDEAAESALSAEKAAIEGKTETAGLYAQYLIDTMNNLIEELQKWKGPNG